MAKGDMLANKSTRTKATARIERDDIRPSLATRTYHLSESALWAVKKVLCQPRSAVIRLWSICSQGKVPSAPETRPKWPPDAVIE